MLFCDGIKDFLFECELRKYTWKTVKGYRNHLEFLCNYLESQHNITKLNRNSILIIR